jgi:hypothetical protein
VWRQNISGRAVRPVLSLSAKYDEFNITFYRLFRFSYGFRAFFFKVVRLAVCIDFLRSALSPAFFFFRFGFYDFFFFKYSAFGAELPAQRSPCYGAVTFFSGIHS